MQIAFPSWWMATKSYTHQHFSDLDHKPAPLVFLMIIPFFVDWLIGLLIIAISYFLKEGTIAIFQSKKTIKSASFTLVFGYLFVFPYVDQVTNLTSFYSKVTVSPITGPDPLASLKEYNIDPYATDPKHEQNIETILSRMDFMDSPEKIDTYIKSIRPLSPITGEMVWRASKKHSVDVRLMLALMENDSHFGTEGKAVRTRNPGNVGNDDTGALKYCKSWEEGVDLVAKWLHKNRKLIRHASV